MWCGWVEKRTPAHVSVELEYRRPVAAVEVVQGGKPGLVFIDVSSALLPSDDFAALQAQDYLRIAGGRETTASVYGSPWGSPRIAGAALRVIMAMGKFHGVTAAHTPIGCFSVT